MALNTVRTIAGLVAGNPLTTTGRRRWGPACRGANNGPAKGESVKFGNINTLCSSHSPAMELICGLNIVFEPDGNTAIVLDRGNKALRRLSMATEEVTTVAADKKLADAGAMTIIRVVASATTPTKSPDQAPTGAVTATGAVTPTGAATSTGADTATGAVTAAAGLSTIEADAARQIMQRNSVSHATPDRPATDRTLLQVTDRQPKSESHKKRRSSIGILGESAGDDTFTTTHLTNRAPPAPFFTIKTGPCTLSSSGGAIDNCVSSRTPYKNHERCNIVVNSAGCVSASPFKTEKNYDKLTVASTAYSGTTGPSSVTVAQGSLVTWYSDVSSTRSGWTLCKSICAPTATAAAPKASAATPTAAIPPTATAATPIATAATPTAPAQALVQTRLRITKEEANTCWWESSYSQTKCRGNQLKPCWDADAASNFQCKNYERCGVDCSAAPTNPPSAAPTSPTAPPTAPPTVPPPTGAPTLVPTTGAPTSFSGQFPWKSKETTTKILKSATPKLYAILTAGCKKGYGQTVKGVFEYPGWRCTHLLKVDLQSGTTSTLVNFKLANSAVRPVITATSDGKLILINDCPTAVSHALKEERIIMLDPEDPYGEVTTPPTISDSVLQLL